MTMLGSKYSFGIQILVLFTLFISANAAAGRDASFQEMCEFYEGTYKARDSYDSMRGDTCTLIFSQATENNETARTYCEEQVPFHITAAIPIETESSTKCIAEATLICESKWIQMFGRCYKMEKRLMTRDEAGKFCEGYRTGGSTIAFMHREALPFRIRDYFTHVSRLWLDASEAITKDLIYNVPDGHLLLAIDGYNYNLPHLALARVKTTEKAMVLCEYTPKMTQAESTYLLKRFSEIYYPTVETSDGSYVRTASSLNRNENDPMADAKYCTKVMRPFIPGGQAHSAIPTQEFMDKVKEMNPKDKGLIIRTSAFSKGAKKSDRQQKACQARNPVSDFQIYVGEGAGTSETIDKSSWRTGEPKEECDAASWSSAVVLSRDGPTRLETMSDARYAPIYCQSIVEKYGYGECPNGFTKYDREALGQRWCHKFITTKQNFADAENVCQTMGSHLTGFTTKEELELLLKLAQDSGVRLKGIDDSTFIGGMRREECTRTGVQYGYSLDEMSPCSRLRVFEWKNGVAPNPPNLLPFWDRNYEPNYVRQSEKCLMMWTGSNKMTLNDTPCELSRYFVCGKEAEIVQVP